MGFNLRVGDTVEVVRGTRNRNPEKPATRGRVLAVNRSGGLVVVEGHNLRTKHLKKSPKHPQGGRLKREASVALSNIKVVIDDGSAVPLRKAARSDDGKVVAKTKS